MRDILQKLAQVEVYNASVAQGIAELREMLAQAVGAETAECPIVMRSARFAPVAQILRDVAAEYEVSPEDVTGPSRAACLVEVRDEVVRRAAAAGISDERIGRVLNRDRSTIMAARQRAGRLISEL